LMNLSRISRSAEFTCYHGRSRFRAERRRAKRVRIAAHDCQVNLLDRNADGAAILSASKN
jgi:hypothetical protein